MADDRSGEPGSELATKIRIDVPHSARIWNYWMGGNAIATYAGTGAVPYILRSPQQIGQCFEGLTMVDPGLVSITQWRPDTVEVGRTEPIDAYGAVARKS